MMENKNVAHNRCILTENFYSHSSPLVSKPVLRRQFKVKTDKLIKETIGWCPDDNLEHGLQKTYEWISEMSKKTL